MNTPERAAVRGIDAPRRPFLVALWLTMLVAAVQWTPPFGPLAERQASSLIMVGPAAMPFKVPGRVDSAALERHVVARFEHWPLARFFFSKTNERELSERIARAIVKEATHLQVEPSLLAGVLLTENAPLDARARSSQGAIGLMQVMQFHAGEYDCDSDDLLQVEANICHGARVLGYYMKRTGSVRRALLRYNGCVSGTNTPNCRRYPSKVLRTASQVRREVLKYPPYSLAIDTTTF
ncbi:MAG TPA: lytic transglycosylase domain-containing protein [Gemmatimonadales bacterium]|nr:lytic transglycosylase domain-containing protein [Gemmatimonadales bacterium]